MKLVIEIDASYYDNHKMLAINKLTKRERTEGTDFSEMSNTPIEQHLKKQANFIRGTIKAR